MCIKLMTNKNLHIKKNTNTWRLKNTLLNNQEFTEKSKRKSKNT